MTAAALEYTADELLADVDYVEPLRVGEVTCHGGFVDDGTYVSPRTAGRVPAIAAWQANHRALFGTDVLDAPLDSWPGTYPTVAQAKLLLRAGVREPIVAQLTRIGTVEAFGARIRHLAPPDLQPWFADDIRGTATAHLGRGLVEAHARDEAGWGGLAGHDTMWFAARDIAFERPLTPEAEVELLGRLGYGPAATTPAPLAAASLPPRHMPDLDPAFEALLTTMVRVLFIEIKAFHVFAYAEALLSDPDLVAGDGEAAAIVACIRSDETPHVDYLRTALTEMRDRTLRTTDGRTVAGRDVIEPLWARIRAESMGPAEEVGRRAITAELHRALEGRRDGADILEQFEALGAAA